MKRVLLFFAACVAALGASAEGAGPVLQYDFSTMSDVTGKYSGTLNGGARLADYAAGHVLDLGTSGWFDLGSGPGSIIASIGTDYTISVNVFVSEGAADANGAIWTFANDAADGYMTLRAATPSFHITTGGSSAEQSVAGKSRLVSGAWNNVAVVASGQTVRIYVNGVSTSKTVRLSPAILGATTRNYIGRSEQNVAAGRMRLSDFRLYDRRLSVSELVELVEVSKTLNAYEDSLRIDALMREFSPGTLTNLRSDIVLPSAYGEVSILWTTSDSNVITASGHVTRPPSGRPVATATLTAHLSCGSQQMDRDFPVTVLPELADDEAVAEALATLAIGGHPNNVYDAVTLPTVGAEGTVVFWKSASPEWMTDAGRVVRLPEGGKRTVVLTATVVKGKARATRDFEVVLHEKEPYANYLFVYFPSNSNENLYYALSNDGFSFRPMNHGEPVVRADTVALKRGLRDPHIMRGPDGWFYMVNTDMLSAEGWESNRGLVMMRSRDLINWSHSAIHFPTKYQGTMFARVIRVWAPETIYDEETGRIMVYFSLRTADRDGIPYDKVYYCYANDDFTDLDGIPTYFYDRGSATIDMDIVYNESDSLYHGFYKTEGEGGICKVTARHLTARPGAEPGSQWSEPSGTLQQTTESVEGAGVFKLINEDSWILMYDCYRNGHYQFCSSPDLENFTFVQNTATSGAFTPRHGTVLPITQAETEALLKAFPLDSATPAIVGSRSSHVKQTNVSVVNNTATQQDGTAVGGTVWLPVDSSADLSAFDPQLYAAPGGIISPQGQQDFTLGPVAYTVTTATSGGQQQTATWIVTAETTANPVLPDFHADPEVLFSRKTGRFYVYPTTDGYAGWGGYSFDVFSSPDLVSFTNEGTILNLQRGHDVPWASGNAWAPSIEEKWIDGKWHYFLYFSGQNDAQGRKTLGVATSENPTGPFRASPQPLFTSSQAGQMIDSDIFTDPATGQSYLYYGNGQLCYRLLSDDMLSVSEREHVITPTGGTLADYAFREGVNVFFRNGLYYFLWSVDDTGARNYHVAYGTSRSPEGPIQVASRPIVIIQDEARQIYGTGHNSVVNIPGTDDWYIVYHRINRHYLSNGPGYHREVCIDKLEFDAYGNIIRVSPTEKGIAPVYIQNVEDIITGIDSLPAADADTTPSAATAASPVVWYAADGRCLGTLPPTAHGLYIRRTTLPDGTTRPLKILR